jgi:VIT1/CCC1 family predicted Fe2+/Mn2+ transporter
MRFTSNFVKKKAMNKLSIIALSFLLVVSCTVQKRLHNPGWNVQWNKKYHTSKSCENPEVSTEEFNHSIASDSFIEDEEEMKVDALLNDEYAEIQSQIEADKDQSSQVKSTFQIVDRTKKTINNKGLTLSEFDKQINDRFECQSTGRSKIDADTIYFILLILGVLVLLGFLLFSSSIWLKIAVVVLCLVLLALLIAAVVVIAEVFYFIFFGWWLG